MVPKAKLADYSPMQPQHSNNIMEAVALAGGEPPSWSPQCACPVLSVFLRTWSDVAGEGGSRALLPYVPRIVGTNDGQSERRKWMILDWFIRECVAIELVCLAEHAAALRSLPAIIDAVTLDHASAALRSAMHAAAARVASHGDAYAPARNAAYYAVMAAASNDGAIIARTAARAARTASRESTLELMLRLIDLAR